MIPTATDITALHDAALERWEREPPQPAPPPAPGPAATLAALIEVAHSANLMIWRLEDQARRRDLGDASIAAIKRAIDPWNQRRNDLMERIDSAVLAQFAKIDVSGAELHSETAGMIIDRLSILALKIRNMDAVAREAGGDGDHALERECRSSVELLRVQRGELAGCLAQLCEDFAAGRRFFRSYRQLKAYNDARLNRALRDAARAAPAYEEHRKKEG